MARLSIEEFANLADSVDSRIMRRVRNDGFTPITAVRLYMSEDRQKPLADYSHLLRSAPIQDITMTLDGVTVRMKERP